MTEERIVFVAFFVLGVALMAVALFRKESKSAPSIEISVDKIGSVRMPFIPFLITLGILVAGVSLLFKWKGYADKIQTLESKQAGWDERLLDLEQRYQRLKSYDLTVSLDFLESVTLPAPDGSCTSSPCLTVETLVKKPSSASFAVGDGRPAPDPDAQNLVAVRVGNLNPGDKIKFRGRLGADRNARTWKSSEIEVPVFSLRMNPEVPR